MTQTFREKPGFTTTDGHRYVSVPVTPIPSSWTRWVRNRLITYASGPYLIKRVPYLSRFVYVLYRYVDGKPIDLDIAPHSRLVDAQASARKNARGEHVVNWA